MKVRLMIFRLLVCVGVMATLLAVGSAQTSAQGDPKMKEARRAAAHRQRRIIYNNDGGDILGWSRLTPGEYLGRRMQHLAGTQVDIPTVNNRKISSTQTSVSKANIPAESTDSPSKEGQIIRNTFDRVAPEGWCSYDYHWSVVAKNNIFIMCSWGITGGVNNSNYIWCDETRWSADTPEKPVSVLPFITYTRWVDREPLDLRDAEVSVYLRGDDLELHGAKCYFWVLGSSGRWHFTSRPLTICNGRWTEKPNVLRLAGDEKLWHHSWPGGSKLDEVLANAKSYGISLVGFAHEPRGKISMDEFEIRLATE